MPEDRMDHLIILYLRGELPSQEEDKLRQWLNANPNHQRIFNETESLWLEADSLSAPHVPSKEEAWQDLHQRLDMEPNPPQVNVLPSSQKHTTSYFKTAWPWYTMAVAAVILMAFIRVFQTDDQDRPDVPPETIWHTTTTSNGQRSQIELADGSKVQLNAGTQLSVPETFADTLRLIRLEGEAYFDIVSDGRPFEIHTPYSAIRVLGTSFNVWTRDQETRVMVKEGRVVLQSLKSMQNQGVVISAKQISIHRIDTLPQTPEIIDIDHRLGWLKGTLLFHQSPMGEVIEELQRQYDVVITVSDTNLLARPLTAEFKDQSLENVLSAICITMGVQYASENNQYRIIH